MRQRLQALIEEKQVILKELGNREKGPGYYLVLSFPGRGEITLTHDGFNSGVRPLMVDALGLAIVDAAAAETISSVSAYAIDQGINDPVEAIQRFNECQEARKALRAWLKDDYDSFMDAGLE